MRKYFEITLSWASHCPSNTWIKSQTHLSPPDTCMFLPPMSQGLVFNLGRAHSTGFPRRCDASQNSWADLQLHEKVEEVAAAAASVHAQERWGWLTFHRRDFPEFAVVHTACKGPQREPIKFN